MGKYILEAEKLSKSFSTRGVQNHILKNIDLKIKEGDFTVIMGASGAGKTTLLYALSGMIRPSLGKVIYRGSNLSELTNDELAIFRREHCGFIFQHAYLIDSMSVMDNVLAAAFLVPGNREEQIQEAKELFSKVGISESLQETFPSRLSGGEAQRCGIVRAMINRPQLLFADEPTGSLDSEAGKNVLDLLTSFNDEGQSILLVTHDIISAERGNRIIYLKDGKIIADLDLEKYEKNDFTRHNKISQFVEEMKLSPGYNSFRNSTEK